VPACPFAEGISLANDLCTMLILDELFAENSLPRDVSSRTGVDFVLVAARLQELESQGMVRAVAESGTDNKLYGLTKKGLEFHPVIRAVQAWQAKWKQD